MSPSESEPTETTVFVGCGAEKQDSPAPARELYTSSYFQKKREYAETVGGLVGGSVGAVRLSRAKIPNSALRRNDRRLSARCRGASARAKYATVEEWAASILEGVENRVHNLDRWDDRDPLGRIVVLAGRKYVEPLREGLDALADEHGFEVAYPFDDTSGIGDQIGWLTEEIEAAEDRNTGISAGSEADPDGEADRGAIPNEDADATEASGPEQADLAGFASRNSGE